MPKIEHPDRDDPCPERGPNLTHVQDGSLECVFCGVITVSGASVEVEAEKKDEPEPGPRRPRRKRSKDKVKFTEEELKHLEFLRFLREKGRI